MDFTKLFILGIFAVILGDLLYDILLMVVLDGGDEDEKDDLE